MSVFSSHLGTDADRLVTSESKGVGIGDGHRLSSDLIGPAGKVPQACDRIGDVTISRDSHWLPVVETLQLSELLRVLLEMKVRFQTSAIVHMARIRAFAWTYPLHEISELRDQPASLGTGDFEAP